MAIMYKRKAKRQVKMSKWEVGLLRGGINVNYREESNITLRSVAIGIR